VNFSIETTTAGKPNLYRQIMALVVTTYAMRTGKLFVIEGADEVGKSTLASLLVRSLRSKRIPCDLVGFPGNEVGTLGRHVYELHHASRRFRVDNINPTSLQIMHVAAHIDGIERTVMPSLRKGRVVVLDRFWWSTWIYGTVGGANKDSLKAAIEVEAIHWKRIRPARVFVITRLAPLEPQRDMAVWKRISAFYKSFAVEERRKYPVTIVENNSTPAAAVAQLERVIGS
jgi:dTMP kinase